MRILTVFGTRPEVIKLAPVIQAAKERGLEVIVCVSGQHRDMLDQMLADFSIVPDNDLDVMQENQSPLEVAARIFEQLSPVIARTRPDWLLVQGDTTTTFAAAWVSFHQRTPVGHVEAGLRTQDKFRPFPEEMNRRLTTVLSDLHFAPTERAAENLRREGVPSERVFLTGNTVVDALHTMLRRAVVYSDPRLTELAGRVVLVTAHRRESFGAPLEEICRALRDLMQAHPDLTVVFPVHRNPAVRKTVFQLLDGHPRMVLTEPLSYPEFVHVMKRADLILSDSGGVQEEAPSIGTPVLVLREVTERPEAIEAGWAQLVGTSREAILAGVGQWFAKSRNNSLPLAPNPFGDGRAGQRIVDLLLAHSRERVRTTGR
jgi:UDP-N-acetylglucosamine 2-epimerase (non-hydrolysing)